jgi:hypothetical protein
MRPKSYSDLAKELTDKDNSLMPQLKDFSLSLLRAPIQARHIPIEGLRSSAMHVEHPIRQKRRVQGFKKLMSQQWTVGAVMS